MDRHDVKRLLAAAMAGAALFFGRSVRADDKMDCRNPSWAPERLPGYEIADCGEKAWMSMDVALKGGGRTTLKGLRSDVAYRLKGGSKSPNDYALWKFFVQQGEAAGAVLASDPGGVSAVAMKRQAADGVRWYLYRPGGGVQRIGSFVLTTVSIAPLKQEVTAKNTAGAWDASAPCSNPPWLVKPFPYFKLDGCDGRDFDMITLDLPAGPKILAGHVIETRYALADGKKSPAALAIWKNYVDALQAIGARMASDPEKHDRAVLTQKTSQGEFWYVYQQSGGDDDAVTSYRLTSVQEGGPTPGSCTLEVYGITFNTNNTAPRSESMPVLTQLLAIFRQESAFDAEIGGHTDDKGGKLDNRKLSGARADAVKAWLTVNGVAGARLTTVGYGDAAPLVPNTSDAGRARNRRIELKRTGCRP